MDPRVERSIPTTRTDDLIYEYACTRAITGSKDPERRATWSGKSNTEQKRERRA